MLRLTFAALVLTSFPPAMAQDQPASPELVASETVTGATHPAGTTLKLEASFQDLQVSSPTAITFDDQGRIYLAESHGTEDDRDHLPWYLDDLAARKLSDRTALYTKWASQISPTRLTEKSEKSEQVRRLADTDGDGKLDESKVIAGDFKDALDGPASSVFCYEGSLYFACIPKIYALRDNERKVVVEGFGVRISLAGHDLHGFTLGPDGRIYGTVGDRGLSLISKAGVSYDYPNCGAAFRFEADGTGFEIFHTGLRNPQKVAFDSLGNAFCVDQNPDTEAVARIVYLLDGGDSGWQMEHEALLTFPRQIGLAEKPPSRWMDEKMGELADSQQPAFMLPASGHLTTGPRGLTAHPGTGFLASEAGRFLVCDYHGSRAASGIWSFAMKPKGAGMELADSRKLLWGVAATDVEYSNDGKIFLSDTIASTDSRLISLDAGEKTWLPDEAKSAAKLMKEGFEQRSSAVLVNLLKHLDARVRLRAHIALTRKSDAVQRFTEAADSSNFMVRIHAIQGLGIVARRGSSPLPVAAFGDIPTEQSRQLAEKKLVALLKDKDPEIRAQSLHALADSNIGANEVPLGPLLGDESLRVQYFAAILAGKRNMVGYYGPICEMLTENNNRDATLRHAGIFALQRMASKPALLTGLAYDESPAVRLAAVVALRRMKNPAVVNFLQDADPTVMDEAIRAICDLDLGFSRPDVAALLDDLSRRSWSPFMLRRLVHNAFRVGTLENATRLLKLAADPAIPDPVRAETLRLLSTWTEPFPVDQFTGSWQPLEKRSLNTLQPALLTALPELLKQDGFVLTAALGLVKQHSLKLPSLTPAALETLVKTLTHPAAARRHALDLLLAASPKLNPEILTELTADPTVEVSTGALAAIAKRTPTAALAPLTAAIHAEEIPRSQSAWPILAALPGPAVDNLIAQELAALATAGGISPTAIETLAAAAQRPAEPVRTALSQLEKSLAENTDPLARWHAALLGGDPTEGAARFAHHPTRPYLLAISARRTDRRSVLEPLVFTRTDIATVRPPLPPIASQVTLGELRDLVAWLASMEPVIPTPVLAISTPITASTDNKSGRQQYIVCSACHGQDGEGTAAAPPLAGSEWVNGPEENLIRIQLRGLQGPITVKGQEYDIPAGMAALAYQSDDQIAAVLTHVRSSFGNSAPAVTPAAVAALRSEVGKPRLVAADLIPVATTTTTPTAPLATSGKYASLQPAATSRKWSLIAAGLLAIALIGGAIRFTRKS